MAKKTKDDLVVTEGLEVAPQPKKLLLTLHAEYKFKDKDGDKVLMKFDGEGYSAKEVLESVEFPKGVNALVNVTVTKGDKEFTKALAPHRARAILEHKDVVSFEESFRGII